MLKTCSLLLISLAFFSNIVLACDSLKVVSGRDYGLPTDLVEAVLKEAQINKTVIKTPWARAYMMATTEKNVMIYALSFTNEREPLFHWVGPLVEIKWYFYRKVGNSSVVINSIEDANNYQIGVVKDFSVTNYLEKTIGKGRLQYTPKEVLNIKKLNAGHVDVISMSDAAFEGNVKAAGLNPSDFEPVFMVKTEQEFIGLSRGTDPITIKKLESAFETIKANGQFQAIHESYK